MEYRGKSELGRMEIEGYGKKKDEYKNNKRTKKSNINSNKKYTGESEFRRREIRAYGKKKKKTRERKRVILTTTKSTEERVSSEDGR